MRLFATFLLPDDVGRHLDTAVRAVEDAANPSGYGSHPEAKNRPALRWTPVEQRHITLAFYGDVALM